MAWMGRDFQPWASEFFAENKKGPAFRGPSPLEERPTITPQGDLIVPETAPMRR
jgi:hypothetical protein